MSQSDHPVDPSQPGGPGDQPNPGEQPTAPEQPTLGAVLLASEQFGSPEPETEGPDPLLPREFSPLEQPTLPETEAQTALPTLPLEDQSPLPGLGASPAITAPLTETFQNVWPLSVAGGDEQPTLPRSQPLEAGSVAIGDQPTMPGVLPLEATPDETKPALGTQLWVRGPDGQFIPVSQPFMLGPDGQVTPMSVAVAAPPTPRPSLFRRLASPLPWWARLLWLVLILASLPTVFLVVQSRGFDWADAAFPTAMVAGGIGGFILLATIVRLAAGMLRKSNSRRWRQVVSALVLMAILGALCGLGLTQRSPIHHLQAHLLENQQHWNQALQEYQLAGERAPGSHDLARTLAEWGEQLTGQQHFDTAIEKFQTVLNTYGSATGEVQRAQKDEITAYFGWGQQASRQKDFVSATSHYDTLLNLPYCNAACQAKTTSLDATAYFDLAEAELASQQYSAAIAEFQLIQTRFASTPEAQKVHAELAKALLGVGKQQRTSSSTCTAAYTTYQQLVSIYGDTPEGQQAANDLQSGTAQPVNGRFTGNIAGIPLAAVLILGLTGDMTVDQIDQQLPDTPIVRANFDGTFLFPSVAPGVYGLVWFFNLRGTIYLERSYNRNGDPAYLATVGLCPWDFGNVQVYIPFGLHFLHDVGRFSTYLTADLKRLAVGAG